MDLEKLNRLVGSGLDAVHFNFWKGWNSRMLLIRMNVKKTFKWRYVTILIVYIQFTFIDNQCYYMLPSCLCRKYKLHWLTVPMENQSASTDSISLIEYHNQSDWISQGYTFFSFKISIFTAKIHSPCDKLDWWASG